MISPCNVPSLRPKIGTRRPFSGFNPTPAPLPRRGRAQGVRRFAAAGWEKKNRGFWMPYGSKPLG